MGDGGGLRGVAPPKEVGRGPRMSENSWDALKNVKTCNYGQEALK